jgi:predicted alpha/beta superfamily hydrolase
MMLLSLILAAQLAASSPEPMAAAMPSRPAGQSEGAASVHPAYDAALSATIGREINVLVLGEPSLAPGNTTPLLLILDGGHEEDFPWIAEALRAAHAEGRLPPLVAVGLANGERRYELTFPSQDPQDLALIPRNGGATGNFLMIRDRLLPALAERFPAEGPRLVAGESLAGLFILDMFRRQPALFDAWLAFDPSTWWRGGDIIGMLRALPPPQPEDGPGLLFTGTGEGNGEGTREAHAALHAAGREDASLEVVDGADHGSIYRARLIQALAQALQP